MSSSLETPTARPLREVAGAGRYLLGVGSIAMRMHAAADMPELVRLFRAAVARLGASDAFFATFVQRDEGFGPCRLLLACDPLWSLEYERANHFATDPWLAYAAAHSAPARDREIVVGTAQAGSAVHLAKRFGFRSALVVPTPTGGSNSRVGALIIGSRENGFFEDDGYAAFRFAARLVGMELNERCAELMRVELLAESGLTSDELKLLAYERDGLSSKNIAKLVGTTDQAINARFKRLMPKFRAHSRSVAARLASDYRLI